MSAILEYREISKRFFDVEVLKNVSFTLRQGTVLGLVGENGAGKSTLMNLLGGVFPYDSGEILLNGKKYAPRHPKEALGHQIAFIHQELNLFTNLSVMENLFLHDFPKAGIPGLPFISRSKMRRKAMEVLETVDLSVSPDMPVEKLSQGERQLVEIAKALNQNAKIIIFDEPTTSLTARETEKLFEIIERLKKSGISMIYISHILSDIYRLCDDLVVLRDGEVVARGASADIPVDRLIPLMVGRTMNQMFPTREHEIGEVVFEVKNLNQPGIVKDIRFQVRAGEVVGISGLMGSGRSELARILFGLDPYESGEIRLKGEKLERLSPRACIERGMAFLTENRREEGLLLDQSISENLALVNLPDLAKGWIKKISRAELKTKVEEIFGAFRIASHDPYRQTVRTLSGGNQQKVVIGKWVINEPTLFILDEPTRGIDVGAKYDVYSIINQLAKNGTAVIMISSELEELLGMCDRILVMHAGELTGEFDRASFDRENILRAALGEA